MSEPNARRGLLLALDRRVGDKLREAEAQARSQPKKSTVTMRTAGGTAIEASHVTVTHRRSVIDATSFGDQSDRYMAGPQSLEIEATCYGNPPPDLLGGYAPLTIDEIFGDRRLNVQLVVESVEVFFGADAFGTFRIRARSTGQPVIGDAEQPEPPQPEPPTDSGEQRRGLRLTRV